MTAKPSNPSQRLKAEVAQQEPVSSDPLTGVMNRAGFDLRFAQEWDRARRAHTPISLLLIDVDHFRAYNKAHVASMGDERLKKIATALAQAVFRPTDLVARYGDDEFAVLLPAVHEEGARVVAARVRSLVNGLAMRHSGGEGGIVTVSIGVAALTPQGDAAPGQLIALSEDALAQAKRIGRDSIVSQDWLA